MLIADSWKNYKILDAGDGEKLEIISGYTVSRPDSQVIWSKLKPELWKTADAIYHRNNEGGGYWQYNKQPKKDLTLSYKDLKFHIELTGFKHIGLFPEQAANWDIIIEEIKKAKDKGKKDIKVLNLFAYTGGATVASAFAGANEIVHIDASKRIVSTAKKNIALNNLEKVNTRFIVEDVMKFVLREVRRERKYDAIIVDPPVYGRGPDGELWQIETSLSRLINECIKLLSDKPIMLLINCYTASISHTSIKNILLSELVKKYSGSKVFSGEIFLPIENEKEILLPAGIYGRFVC